ncbi:hypothetical protein ACVWWJ_000921 [Luteibacter sp. HA06]
MKARLIAAALAGTIATDACAEIKWLSRANCVAGIVNESVTYDRPKLNGYWMNTFSTHVGFGAVGGHTLASPRAFTWRSYAGDLMDATRNTVTGTHFFTDEWHVNHVAQTIATNCNLREW